MEGEKHLQPPICHSWGEQDQLTLIMNTLHIDNLSWFFSTFGIWDYGTASKYSQLPARVMENHSHGIKIKNKIHFWIFSVSPFQPMHIKALGKSEWRMLGKNSPS